MQSDWFVRCVSVLAVAVSSPVSTSAESSFLDDVVFGDDASESAHAFTESESSVTEGGLDEPCRRIALDGHLTFKLRCDPARQNYLTVKLWGSETGDSQLHLYDGIRRIGKYQGQWPELDLLRRDPFFPGRFYYSTYMIPVEMTRGKAAVILRIGSTGQPTPYSRDRKEADQKGLSRGVYRAYVGVDPFFVPTPNDRPGAAPGPAPPLRHPSGLSPLEHLRRQLDLAVDRMLGWQYYGSEWDRWVADGKAPAVMTGAIVINGAKDARWTRKRWKDESVRRGGVHVRCQMVPEIYSRAFRAKWSKHFGNEVLIDRVVRALDFYCIAQGGNGGFVEIEDRRDPAWIGGPDRKDGNGCLMGFGMMGPPAAFLVLQGPIQTGGYLDQAIDDDDPATPKVTRRVAYATLFAGAREYLVSPVGRGHAPNQDMADIVAATLCDRCVRVLAPARAWPDEKAMRFLHAACGLEKDIYGGQWISTKGLSCEPHGTSNGGYCGNYGEHVVAPMFRLAELTGDARIRDRAVQVVHALARFRYPSLDADLRNCIRLEGVVTWRNNFAPGRISYGGNAYAAAVVRDSISIRELQLAAAQADAYRVNLDRTWVHLQSSAVELLRSIDHLERALALPPTGARLPFEAGQPDFVWTDEEAGAVVVKRGDTRLMMSLNWRHGFKTRERSPRNAVANDVARVHFRTPTVARIANVRMESVGGYGGVYVCRYGDYLVVINASDGPRRYQLADADRRYTRDLVRQTRRTADTIALSPRQTAVLFAEGSGRGD